MWEQILTRLGVTAIIVVPLVWLARKVFEHWLNKDIESYRNKLTFEHEAQLEKLRNDLKLLAVEHEIKFRSIHEKQAEVIAETYAILHKVYENVASYVAIFEWSNAPSKEEKLNRVMESYEVFRDYFFPRQLFFPEKTKKKVKDLSNELVSVSNIFTWGLRREKEHRGYTPPEKPEDDHWVKAAKIMEEKIPPLLKEIESDFQKLLGVSQSTGANNGKESDEVIPSS